MTTIFTYYVSDTRYSVPTIAFMVVEQAAQARTHAARLLKNSPHHTAVSVYQADNWLFTVGGDTDSVSGEPAFVEIERPPSRPDSA